MCVYIYIYIYVYICLIAFTVLNEKKTFYLHRYSGTVFVDQLRDLIDVWSTHTVKGFEKVTKIFVEISAFSFTIQCNTHSIWYLALNLYMLYIYISM